MIPKNLGNRATHLLNNALVMRTFRKVVEDEGGLLGAQARALVVRADARDLDGRARERGQHEPRAEALGAAELYHARPRLLLSGRTIGGGALWHFAFALRVFSAPRCA